MRANRSSGSPLRSGLTPKTLEVFGWEVHAPHHVAVFDQVPQDIRQLQGHSQRVRPRLGLVAVRLPPTRMSEAADRPGDTPAVLDLRLVETVVAAAGQVPFATLRKLFERTYGQRKEGAGRCRPRPSARGHRGPGCPRGAHLTAFDSSDGDARIPASAVRRPSTFVEIEAGGGIIRNGCAIPYVVDPTNIRRARPTLAGGRRAIRSRRLRARDHVIVSQCL